MLCRVEDELSDMFGLLRECDRSGQFLIFGGIGRVELTKRAIRVELKAESVRLGGGRHVKAGGVADFGHTLMFESLYVDHKWLRVDG